MIKPTQWNDQGSLGRMLGNMYLFSEVGGPISQACSNGDASTLIKRCNEALVLARSSLAAQSSMKSRATAIQSCHQRLQVDPVRLFKLSLVYQFILAAPGAKRIEAASRKKALFALLPRLKPYGDLKSIEGMRRAKEFKKLYLSFKGMVEKPSRAMKPLFEQALTDLKYRPEALLAEFDLAEIESPTFH